MFQGSVGISLEDAAGGGFFLQTFFWGDETKRCCSVVWV